MSTQTHSTPVRPGNRGRLWLIGLVLTLLAAACGSTADGATEVANAAEPTEAEATPAPTETAEPAAEPTSELAAPAAPSAEPAPPVQPVSNPAQEFEVLIEGEITFSEDGPMSEGTLTVLEGGDALGCDGGTTTEDASAPTVVRLWTCTSGSGTGTITITFVPFDGPWNVTDATGDFQGLSGTGEWFGVVNEDGTEAADSLTGTMSFGNTNDSTETAVDAETAADADEAGRELADLGFEGCGMSSVCATVQVPLDYATPDGEATDIHVTIHPATGNRIGTLFVNPGGPGGSVEEMAKGFGSFGPPGITERFDVVGIDPRGTGKSRAIDCNPNWEEDSLQDFTPGDGFADDAEVILADFSDMAAICLDIYGVDYLASVTTENAARDMETIRVLLGDEPLNYLGFSYGTAIGSVYATLFPDVIRSMVLDGAVPTNPVVGDDDRPPRFEEALLRLDQTCAEWISCPLGDVSLLAAIAQVRDELRANGTIGPLERHVFERAVFAQVAVPQASVDVAQGLADALDGDGELLNNIGLDFLTPLESGSFEEYSGAFVAIICADGWNLASGTAAEVAPRLEATYSPHPNAGPGFDVPCDLWPVTGPGMDPVSYTGDAPILVVGATDDAITPLLWSEQLAAELGDNASLLIREGSGHISLSAADCIEDQVVAFLVDLDSPVSGTTCELAGLIGTNSSSDPVRIIDVALGSPAELAGLEVGDRVITADGEPVQFEEEVPGGTPGDPLELVIERDGEEMTFTITREPVPWERWRD